MVKRRAYSAKQWRNFKFLALAKIWSGPLPLPPSTIFKFFNFPICSPLNDVERPSRQGVKQGWEASYKLCHSVTSDNL